MTVFQRVMLANLAVGIAGLVAVVASGRAISGEELAVLVAGGAVMLAVDAVLVWRALVPLERLRDSMRRIDPLEPGVRLDGRAADGTPADLAQPFNAMAVRLEAERRESARRLLADRETEQRRLARELHDELGQSLTALLMHLERAERRVPEPLRGELVDAQEATRTSLDELRRIVRRLRPDALEDLGLASALRALATWHGERTGMTVEAAVEAPLPQLSREAELVIYRIAQEALTNAARHAEADSVRLVLECDDGGVRLRVTDDGRGLPRTIGPASGIRGMRERALLVGGRLLVGDRPGGGVEVRLDVPILEAHA
ncbi:MAG: sensor histidine kinase [Solirubrobacteraceae bacterium]